MQTDRFSDYVVLIFGGTSGIGLMTMIDFINNGASHIIIASRSDWKWNRAINKLKEVYSIELNQIDSTNLKIGHSTIEYYPCDVRLEDSVKETIQYTINKYQYINVYFNNAGIQPTTGHTDGEITELEFPSSQDEAGIISYHVPLTSQSQSKSNGPCSTPASPYCENPIATFVMGLTYCLKTELNFALKQNPAIPVSIINTCSRNGVNIPSADRPIYSACKAFIYSITQTSATQATEAAQKRGQSIRINCIAPGPILTPLEIPIFVEKTNVFDNLSPTEMKTFKQKGSVGVPLKRTGRTNEISPTVLFLADETQSSYITGSCISIDGGYTASPVFN